ncbi:MAG TPA: T9SS type A sorting domain-containing protein [Rhodothermales bacterium]|nr:T9SS type A sorting domain-containing protein [Rhodothermales bacterium]
MIVDADVVEVSGHPLAAGDEIAVVTGDGKCVGTNAWKDSSFAITVWGKDQFSDGAGMETGNALHFVVWDVSDSQEYQDVAAKYSGGKPYLRTDGIFAKGAVYELASLALNGDGEAYNPGEALKFALEQNYPNPVRSSTTIQYGLETDADVKLELYNMLGQRVRILADEQQKAGRYEIHLDARDLPSGAYIYRLRAGQYVESKTLVIVK